MSDVNIKYNGTSIATMDASGTKTLQTSGKYCEGNITVEYTDQEKPTQSKTVTPNAAGQTVTPDSGKVLSSVVINGDADLVAGNIKKDVSIFGVTGTLQPGASNVRKIEFTLASTQTTNYNILTADADVIAHYADANATCILECLDAPTASNSVRWIYASNTPLYGTYYQTRVQYVSGWGQAFSGSPLSNGNAYHNIWARSNGNLVVMVQSTRPLLAGNYRAIFMW